MTFLLFWGGEGRHRLALAELLVGKSIHPIPDRPSISDRPTRRDRLSSSSVSRQSHFSCLCLLRPPSAARCRKPRLLLSLPCSSSSPFVVLPRVSDGSSGNPSCHAVSRKQIKEGGGGERGGKEEEEGAERVEKGEERPVKHELLAPIPPPPSFFQSRQAPGMRENTPDS